MQRFKEKTGERYKSSGVDAGSMLDALLLVRDKYTMRCVSNSRARCNDLNNAHILDDIARHELMKYDKYFIWRWEKLFYYGVFDIVYVTECDE